ncbi:MAG TPA: DegQ family serine endoprotease [Bryobacteraceae bacterium]|nr:DegQ family serine endoprotease [Bryobacteraceae bacterium]
MRTKALAVACAITLSAGLLAAALETRAHISLKLADPNEAPSRVTMAPAAKTAMPAVVKISASKVVKTPAGFSGGEEQLDPLFRQFFGNDSRGLQPQQPRSHVEGGLGSGVVVSPDGYILTNNHVVDGATNVSVTLPDRREFKAKVIGTDPKTDIAVVKIDAANLPVITIGNSSKMQVGDAVLAIGNPYGVGQTVTMGIVSATGRAGLGIEDYEDFIQTDASINPGNSGGALVNDRGELIGINTAILAPGSGGNQGIGFAVPVNLARNVMDQIVTHGSVERAYLGVSIQPVTPGIAKAIGLNAPDGALVSEVSPNSPASRAGMQSGDVILSMNGTPIAESNQLRMNVSLMNPGQTVHLKVFRDGQTRDVTAQVGEMPGKKVETASRNNATSGSDALEGVSVEDLNARTAREAGLSVNTRGVVVTEVDPASAAAQAGLQEGDVIQEVNHHAVASSDDLSSALHKGESLLLVNRGGNKFYLAV